MSYFQNYFYELHLELFVKYILLLYPSIDTPNLPEREAFGFFDLKSNVFSSTVQQSLNLKICLCYTFSFKMYMPTKNYLRKKAIKW